MVIKSNIGVIKNTGVGADSPGKIDDFALLDLLDLSNIH